ncbi:MAG: hypothetical protein SOZ02_01165 [Hallerella porci]|uniref:Uncharacterized protein n=1 Tax=Hallerella porci TaxID=1945871 RepID=A0ABX5LNI2_9BACT|nr:MULTISPECIES: hypothetical protein [Hallerella]MCI5601042.1 hypothetical protein [Hallerella sp.]MDY3920757.1 hypothetical protein [Hallerella porci]PWL03867.1 hypothetical protein B0H50_10238 [Hallerella porci]
MKGRQYQYQSFLLQCPYWNIELEKYRRKLPKDIQLFVYERNLFDFPNYQRMIPLTYLDYNIDTQSDLNKLVYSMRDVQALYIVDNREKSDSIFVKKHSEATKQAFIWQIENLGISCYLASIN